MVLIGPSVRLNDGESMPVVGLGTFGLRGTEGRDVVKAAIDAGYRHFDTAMVYHSERAVGEAIGEKIAEGVVGRKDLFVTSKLWCSYAHPGLVAKGCRRTLDELGMDYVDLYLMHWPFAFRPVEHPDEPVAEFEAGAIFEVEEYFPRDAAGNLIVSDVDYVDVWKEMEQCVESGMVKSIGVSNFNSKQIERLVRNARIKPVVNEVELHPYFNQKKLIRFCKERDIVVTAYSSLSGRNPGEVGLLENPVILKLANEINRTPAQVVLRYVVQLGAMVIPKASKPKRLAENIDIFDFALSPKQMAEMDSLNRNHRSSTMPGTENHKYYPFNCEF